MLTVKLILMIEAAILLGLFIPIIFAITVLAIWLMTDGMRERKDE